MPNLPPPPPETASEYLLYLLILDICPYHHIIKFFFCQNSYKPNAGHFYFFFTILGSNQIKFKEK